MNRPFVIAGAVALACLLAVPPAGACSMCHCGDSAFMVAGDQVFAANKFHFGLDLGRFAKDQVAEDDPLGRERETESRVTLTGMYTVGDRLTLMARLPVARRTIVAGPEEASLTGVSDPELVADVRLLGSTPRSWLSVNGGVRTGWGQNHRVAGGVRAEEHLQPGTGAAGALAGASASHPIGESGSVFGSVQGRFNGRNDVGYRYGNVFLANAAYQHRLVSALVGVLELNFRAAAHDEAEVGSRDENTGGSVLYISPRVLYQLRPGLFFRLGVQVPVASHLYGIQSEKTNVLSGLTMRF